MTTIEQAITAILATLNKRDTTFRQATDEEVADKLRQMAQWCGYRPSLESAEPVRAYLSGYSILLTGETGVGKTFFMRCLGVRLYLSDEISDYGLSRINAWYSWTDERDICIDDLGSERMVSEYGARDDLMKAVIAHRLDHQTDRHDPTNVNPARVGRTHITTNLTAEQIAERYGDRTLSRILGMCKPFTIVGDNQRVPKQHLRTGAVEIETSGR